MRRTPSAAERRVWDRVRHDQLGVKFRRQHQLSGYFADFVCLERWLVVELDGGQHTDDVAYDAARTRALEALGFRVLRFWNDDALLRTDEVLAAIMAALDQASPPHPNPLPRRRRGRGSRETVELRERVGREGSHKTGNEKDRLESIDSFECGKDRSGREGAEARARREGIESREGMQSRQGKEGKDKLLRDPHGDRGDRRETLPLPRAVLGGEGWGEGAKPPQAARHAFRDLRHRALAQRASLYRLIRHFFDERGVLEVETPMLSAAGNTDPNIESFVTRFSGHRDAGRSERWLRTSPEFPLKRLLAAGVGDCYELGRVFRNGEAGRRHNPEFTMLEWYRVGWDHCALLEETIALVTAALAARGRHATLQRYTYRELFLQHLELDPFTAADTALAAPLAEYSIDPAGLERDDWLDLLLTHRIQPQFAPDCITAIHDYPASQCALARLRGQGEAAVAERFELYLGPYELANGYHELNDAVEQRARFVRDNTRRRGRGLAEVPLDENLLAALPQLPDCAGVALGIERLLMCLDGVDDIAAVVAFPFAQA